MECIWVGCVNPDGDIVWETLCNNRFSFSVDGPEENGFQYCPYCSRKLVQEELLEEEE